jgi:phosphopantothenoylcysteine decarboxylase/phosphopantothenate--cysteine ligase
MRDLLYTPSLKAWFSVRDKSILLIVGGGIAAYKSLELVRRLAERGVASRAILTRAGAQFVTPLSLAALTAEPVHQDLFSLTDEARMGHIELSRSADLVVVAPATADLMAKMANGLANDLASTTLLATDKPVLMAPAMNVRMWQSPSVRRNFETLKRDGVLFVGPDDGEMACGEFGPGRMAEPLEIAAAIERVLGGAGTERPLHGIHALITAGPTCEPIDPVRFLTNHSSGKQGYAIAGALARLGARTTLVSGPVSLAPPPGVTVMAVNTAREMLAACESALPADVLVMAAAVADWRPDTAANSKIKKSAADSPESRATPQLKLVENPDILATLAAHPRRPRLVVGFAAETDNVVANATAKRGRKGADWIIANDVSGNVMGGERNRVHLVSATGVEDWPEMTKTDVATHLAARIAAQLKGDTDAP